MKREISSVWLAVVFLSMLLIGYLISSSMAGLTMTTTKTDANVTNSSIPVTSTSTVVSGTVNVGNAVSTVTVINTVNVVSTSTVVSGSVSLLNAPTVTFNGIPQPVTVTNQVTTSYITNSSLAVTSTYTVVTGTVAISGTVPTTTLLSTSILSSSATVNLTASIISASDTSAKGILVVNVSSNTIYLGGSTVTTNNGIPILANGNWSTDIFNGNLYAIAGTGGNEIRIMKQ